MLRTKRMLQDGRLGRWDNLKSWERNLREEDIIQNSQL